jgi:RNA polymerase sigma factor (sigma-70 family)
MDGEDRRMPGVWNVCQRVSEGGDMITDQFEEWLCTQPKEVQDEFNGMERLQDKIDNKELCVSQIYYGEKPICKDAMERIRYELDSLTDRQRDVYQLCHVDGLTQEEAGDRLGICQRSVSNHIEAIRKKIKKILDY